MDHCVCSPSWQTRMRVLMPLPDHDYDPTEAGVSHAVIRAAGHEIVFATPAGQPAHADPLMLTGVGLDPWGGVPGLRQLVLVGRFLRADAAGRAAHAAMCADPAYAQPLRYGELDASQFDGLLLPGGHAPGMRSYLESTELQRLVAQFFAADKAVGAICHGVVLAARSLSAQTGRSVLHGRRTTALPWVFERKAWQIARLTRFWDPHYYRTYREQTGEAAGYRSVEAEVTRALARPEDFLNVQAADADYRLRSDGLHRDRLDDARPAFVVSDGRYISARWPGDTHSFARRFVEVLEG